MAKIEGVRIHNYKTLKDATLGAVGINNDAKPLTPLTVVIGKNGVGKSTLFDVFGFLYDSLKYGVEEACENRGGFDAIRSKGQDGAIEIEITYRETPDAGRISYLVVIDLNENGRPSVKFEVMSAEEIAQNKTSLLNLSDGKGTVADVGNGGRNIKLGNFFKAVKGVVTYGREPFGKGESFRLVSQVLPRHLSV